jgi:hypothetical protein
MTHAVDVDGVIYRFYSSREEAERYAAQMAEVGHDVQIVEAKPYIPREP